MPLKRKPSLDNGHLHRWRWGLFASAAHGFNYFDKSKFYAWMSRFVTYFTITSAHIERDTHICTLYILLVCIAHIERCTCTSYIYHQCASCIILFTPLILYRDHIVVNLFCLPYDITMIKFSRKW